VSKNFLQNIVIAGNPNCGKSTLFNALTGLRQKTGNYPGVTVEKKTGRLYGLHGEIYELLDLPGSYSLQVRSPDEAVSRDVLLGRQSDTPPPDAIICVVDASNLERNLYLTSQLLELELPTVLALNMVDVAEQEELHIDVPALEKALGIPVVPMVASEGRGLVELKTALATLKADSKGLRATMPDLLEKEVQALGAQLVVPERFRRAEALLLIGQTDVAQIRSITGRQEDAERVTQSQARLQEAGLSPVSTAVEARYAWLQEICSGSVRREGDTTHRLSLSDRLDAVFIHKFWGWTIFLGVMGLMFFSIFTIANYPMEWIDAFFTATSGLIREHLPPGDFRSLLTDGIIAGVGGVVIFLPQILILFLFLGILEDSGYMARAAFIMDRFMAKVGLHGKSFIPMLSSFACAIPGIMATRTIENRKDRLVTILVAPLMSCSARLPVYALMIALLFPPGEGSALEKAGIMLAAYLLGATMAFIMAWIFKKTLLKGERPMLLLELPPYRLPSVHSIALRMMERAGLFLKRAGTVIFCLSILLWALATYPKPADPDVSHAVAMQTSFAGHLGRFIEPVLEPLGYDWKIGIGLVASLAAREVFVGTMAIVYNVESETGDSQSLQTVLQSQTRPDGSPVFTPLTCIGLMVFYVLAMQCIATLAIVRRETNSWRWPIFQFAYMTLLAWTGSFIVYQGGHLLGYQ